MATDAKLQIGPADHGRRFTADEFLGADLAEGHRYELAGGILEVTEIPGDAHFFVVSELFEAIGVYRRDHPGRILAFGGGSEVRVWMPESHTGRHPDVAVVLAGAVLDARGHRRASIAVEVVSPGARARDRDLVAKRDDYLAYGLDEYWIVDPTERRVLVLVRDGDRWIESPFVAGQQAEGRALPGFRVPVEELWAAHDRGLADEPGEG